LGEKWEEVKKNLLLLLLLPLATKWGSSFLLFKRVKSNLALSFPDIIFSSNFERSCFHNLLG
jgi:hypothetical protein